MSAASPFVQRAVRRKRLFLVLSVIGVAVGLALAGWWGYRRVVLGESLELRAVVVLLVLLNARNQLRQFRYAAALEGLLTQQSADAEAHVVGSPRLDLGESLDQVPSSR